MKATTNENTHHNNNLDCPRPLAQLGPLFINYPYLYLYQPYTPLSVSFTPTTVSGTTLSSTRWPG